MAFYQMNRIQIGDSAALVSLGGTFSDRQITGVMERFPNARAFDCFDNDLAGRDIRTAHDGPAGRYSDEDKQD